MNRPRDTGEGEIDTDGNEYAGAYSDSLSWSQAAVQHSTVENFCSHWSDSVDLSSGRSTSRSTVLRGDAIDLIDGRSYKDQFFGGSTSATHQKIFEICSSDRSEGHIGEVKSRICVLSVVPCNSLTAHQHKVEMSGGVNDDKEDGSGEQEIVSCNLLFSPVEELVAAAPGDLPADDIVASFVAQIVCVWI